MKSRTRRFLLEFAWRDLRTSGPSLWVFCACLVLGVTLVVATGGLYRLISDGLLADTRQLLGGDLEVDAEEPLPDNVLTWMNERGDVSLVTEVDTMLGTAEGDFLRVELQAMDAAYPLYGQLTLSPAMPLADATSRIDGQWGVAIDPVQADRLGLSVGDEVSIGTLTMRVRALVLEQPDRALNAEWRGAPVLLSDEALNATGLLGVGSLADYDYRVRTDTDPYAWRDEFREAFPEANWDVRTFEDRGRRIAERLGQLASGLMIIALSTLFVGGLGVFNSIQAYLQQKRPTIATLRTLGLREKGVATVYMMQVAIMSAAAGLVGALLGGGLALAGVAVVADELPLATTAASLALPVFAGLVFGMLTAFAFALPSVGQAVAVDPASLFRSIGNKPQRPAGRWLLATGIVGALLASMVLVTLPDTWFAIGFLVTVALLLLLLDAIVRGTRRLAKRLDDSPLIANRFELRLALANLHRPGTPLRSMLVSLGSALTLLVVCTMVVLSLFRTLNNTIPAESPALVLYDVLDTQLDAVINAADSAGNNVRVETTPLVRTRITAINGTPVAELDYLSRERRRDASQDDYDLSYSADNIDDVTVVEGAWWTEDEPAQARIALEDREARQLSAKVGDVITFGVAGSEFDARVDAVFSQKGIQTRFWFEGIVSDGALEGFIDRHVGAVYTDDATAIEAQRRIGRVAPTAVTVRTAALLASARSILGKAAAALAVVAGTALLASALVLVSVMAAGRSRLVYDATVLHSLGARLSAIRRSLRLEYLLLGLVTSGVAVLLGTAIAFPLLVLRLKLPTDGLMFYACVAAAGTSSVALYLAARYFFRRLRLRPATLLRGAN